MMNHAAPKADVTDGYDQWFLVENLREPMQRITNFVLSKVNGDD